MKVSQLLNVGWFGRVDSESGGIRGSWFKSGGASLLALLMVTGPAMAQEEDGEKEERERGILEMPVGENWLLSPIILPIYSPETEAGLALGGMATFSTQPGNDATPRSTITLSIVPTSSGSIYSNLELEGFWLGDQLRTPFKLEYDDKVDNYWGVGHDAGKDIDQDEDVTEYESTDLALAIEASWRIHNAWYAGLNFDYLHVKVDDESLTMETDENYQLYGGDVTSVGLGLQLSYDTRDDTLNAYEGEFFKVEATPYLDALGSDQEFQVYSVDYRRYHNIGRPEQTLAWQLYGRYADGDVPWTKMSTVGSSRDLRGYYSGRFRDNAVVYGLAEFRRMTDTRLWRLGRNGWAAWAGLAFIGEDFGDLSGHELPNAGVGYRLEIQPRRNLRLDVGWGYDELGIYVAFAEAF